VKKTQGTLLLLGLRIRLRTVLSRINRMQRFDDQSDSRRIHRTLNFLYGTAGNVLIGVSDARVHSRHVFDQLGQVLELGPSAGQHNAGDQLLFISRTFNLVINMFNDLFHAGLNDVGQVPDGNLFRLPAAQTGDGYDLAVLVFVGQCGSEFELEQFRLVFHDHAPFADVFRYDIAPQRNDGGMPDDIIVENGNIGGAASDIDQYHARFLLLRTKNRFRRRKGLQDQILGFQTGLGNAFVDVADGVHLPGNDVKVRFQPNPRHTDRIGDSRFIIHGEFLRQYMNDLLAGRHHQALHILDEAIDIRLADLRIGIVPGKNTAVLETADVLPG